MTLRVCLEDGCPVLVDRGRCITHQRQTDHARTTAARGYGSRHQRERRMWQQRIDAGEPVICWRCTQPITPGQAMDLGHTDERDTWAGPEHSACNRAAAGRD